MQTIHPFTCSWRFTIWRKRNEACQKSHSLVLAVAHHTQNGETQRVRPAVLRTCCDYGFVAGFFIMDVIGA
jgi:hypothetical protein